MLDLVPGGYLFSHIIFWTVVAMIAVGTMIIPITLSVGFGILILESLKKD